MRYWSKSAAADSRACLWLEYGSSRGDPARPGVAGEQGLSLPTSCAGGPGPGRHQQSG